MPTNQLVVLNSGSSSIKFASYDCDEMLSKTISGQVRNLNISPVLEIFDTTATLIEQTDLGKDFSYEQFYDMLVSAFASNRFNYKVTGVGHRVVHGGPEYPSPVIITQKVIDTLKTFISFAPLHQPYNLQAIECIRRSYPELVQVACFDTSFHRTHPSVADIFALPRNLTESGIRRYGFHGLSYEYIYQVIKKTMPEKSQGRIIVAHLGNGSSMCAIKNGVSIDTTMGFTALDGLMMGTRCGSLDPGVIIYLLEHRDMSSREIENMLYRQSGLLGVSGISQNMKQLLDDNSASAREAVDLYVYRIRKELGALMAALSGLDLLVFTGGIGENSSRIRSRVCRNNEWLGLTLDEDLNTSGQTLISTPGSKIDICVIPTNEEWVIASHTYALIKKESSHG